MDNYIKFKHKSGKILNGNIINSFIYKNKNKCVFVEYLKVKGDDNKLYSVNPKNIINETKK